MWPFLPSVLTSSFSTFVHHRRLHEAGEREQEGTRTINLPPRQVIPQVPECRIQHRPSVEAGQRRRKRLVREEERPLVDVGSREGRDDGCCYFAKGLG